MKHRESLKPKLQSVVSVLQSIDLTVTERKEKYSGHEYTYLDGERNGTIRNKILVARRMLMEISKELDK